MNDVRIAAAGLLTQQDLDRLGPTFNCAIPVVDDGMFDDLLAQLNEIHIEPLGKGAFVRTARD